MPLSPQTYIQEVSNAASNQNFALLPQLLSLQALLLALPTKKTQKAFFEALSTSQLPTNYPFSSTINTHIQSTASLWHALDLINSVRVMGGNPTNQKKTQNNQHNNQIAPTSSANFTLPQVNSIIDTLSTSHSLIESSAQSLLDHVKSLHNHNTQQNKTDADKFTQKQTPQILLWRLIVNTIFSQFRFIARLLDTFYSLKILLYQTSQGDSTDNTTIEPIDYSTIQLTSQVHLIQVSNIIKSFISVINADTRTNLFRPITLSSSTQLILTFFAYHSTQYAAVITQLTKLVQTNGREILEIFPKSDQIQYHYCLGQTELTKRQYALANYYLSQALKLCISYPWVNLSRGENNVIGIDSVEYQNSKLRGEYLHNIRLIIRLLCPLRLSAMAGSFSPINSLTYKPDNPSVDSNINHFDPVEVILGLDGIFSPPFLNSIGLPIEAELSKAVMNGDVYTFTAISNKNIGYFIKTGTYVVVQRLPDTVWLRLFYILQSKITFNQPNPNVIRWTLVITALNVMKRKFIQNCQNMIQNGENCDSSVIDTVQDYDVDDLECIAVNLIFSDRIKAYVKPNVALVLSKNDSFQPSWVKLRARALGCE
jgi:hypothetical protein